MMHHRLINKNWSFSTDKPPSGHANFKKSKPFMMKTLA
jgi:hypothetical protein